MTEILWPRLILIAAWASVGIFMASGAWAVAVRRNVRRGDPMRLACFITALIFIGYSARALLAPESEWVWMALHLLSAVDAVLIIALGRTYGRGPLIAEETQ